MWCGVFVKSFSDMTTGDGEEYVIEVRGVDRQPLDCDMRLVQLVEQLTEGVHGAICGDLQDQLVLVRSSRREKPGRRAQQVGSSDVEADVPAGDPALQLSRGSFGDDSALVEHSDPVGQLVCLVEILGEIGRAHRLNSSHANISYAVFCLKKKIQNQTNAVTGAQRGPVGFDPRAGAW